MAGLNFLFDVLGHTPGWVWAVLAALLAAGALQMRARAIGLARATALPLALMLGIFCTRFAVSASLAMHPGLVHVRAFAVSACLAYGAFSGIFGARLLMLWRLSRQPPRLGAA